MPRPSSRIAITGVGAVTPHASTLEGSWAAWLRGEQSVRRISLDELGWSDLPGGPQGQVWGGAPASGLHRASRSPGGDDPVIGLALRATRAAVTQAGLAGETADPDRVACVYGTSKGGLDQFAALWRRDRESPVSGRTTASDFPFWQQAPPSAAVARLAAEYGWRAAAVAPVAACATGLICLLRGAALIRDGLCDVAVAGSSDASLHPAVLGSFQRLGVLAQRHLDPACACRPFDAERCGFHVGEGAATLVLERWEHARARGVPILAEWIDGMERGDPCGLTVLPEDATALDRLVRDLLDRCGLSPSEIDAVSLHGTGTRMNDAYESQGLQRALGPALDDAALFGLKGGMGHLLGGAGSVETAAAVCVLRHQIVPPTVNCERPAPDCVRPLVLGAALPRPVRNVLKLSLGFGGHLAAGLLGRAE